ncbi:DUF362 domain-containing protein [Ruminococcaceae bacterium OttesenSCG-928-A16]|nr:DUF362 domain-containing protein [Ruminococcaceae bacterium OttesenSCG-928-A16]
MNLQNNVYIQQATLGKQEEINEATSALLALLPMAARLNAATKVVLKPNLLAKHAPQKAVTTHPSVVRAVILALQKYGVTNITLADSPGGLYTPASMRAIYKESGLAAVCEETGVKLYTECKSVMLQGSGKLVKQFEVLEPIANCDVIINLPKLKTHVMAGMSGAVKNLFGCVPGLRKAEFHMQFPQKENFGQMLVDLCETLPPQIHIVDGVLGMEGDGPGSGTPRVCNMLLAGQNPYTLDLALAHYMGMNPAELPVATAAHNSGLAPLGLDMALLQPQNGASTAPFAGFVQPRSYQGNINFEQNAPAFLRPAVGAVTRRVAPRPKIEKGLCIGCGKCAEICPVQVISIQNKKAKIATKNCIHCFCCHEVCPVKAISVKRSRLFRV